MRRRAGAIAVAGMALAALVALMAVVTPARAAEEGITVDGTGFVAPDGSPLVLRGVNHAHAWFPGATGAFGEIAATGANAVRVVLSNGTHGIGWSRNDADDVERVIALCAEHDLVCVLEVHDTTGYGDDSKATTLAQAARYWADLAPVLRGHEDRVVINIGNEPFGNAPGDDQVVAETAAAVRAVRAAGLTHALVVDAPQWGQDWRTTMARRGAEIVAADPRGDTMLSVHMYEVYATPAAVTGYLDRFRSQGLPIMIGEFGFQHGPQRTPIPTRAIYDYADQHGLSWFAWSWCGNGGGVDYLDLRANRCPTGNVPATVPALTEWGREVVQRLGDTPTPRPAPSATPTTPTGTAPSVAPSTAPNGRPYCGDGYVDPDGDGWGWWQERSCIVRGGPVDPLAASPGASSPATALPSTAPNGRPYCGDGYVDPDGDGWGWWQERSCIVRGGPVDR